MPDRPESMEVTTERKSKCNRLRNHTTSSDRIEAARWGLDAETISDTYSQLIYSHREDGIALKVSPDIFKTVYYPRTQNSTVAPYAGGLKVEARI